MVWGSSDQIEGCDYWRIGKMLVRHNWPIMRCVVEEDFAGGGGRPWYG